MPGFFYLLRVELRSGCSAKIQYVYLTPTGKFDSTASLPFCLSALSFCLGLSWLLLSTPARRSSGVYKKYSKLWASLQPSLPYGNEPVSFQPQLYNQNHRMVHADMETDCWKGRARAPDRHSGTCVGKCLHFQCYRSLAGTKPPRSNSHSEFPSFVQYIPTAAPGSSQGSAMPAGINHQNYAEGTHQGCSSESYVLLCLPHPGGQEDRNTMYTY